MDLFPENVCKYKPTSYPHFFPEIPPLLPKASRRGVAKSSEIAGGEGGPPTGGSPGWLESGEGFLAPTR